MKHLILALLLITIFSISAFAEPAPYTNLCPGNALDDYYCKYLGKEVYWKDDKKKAIIGTVVTVTMKEKGDILTYNPKITATKDGFYYVLDTGDEKLGQFLANVKLVKVVKDK